MQKLAHEYADIAQESLDLAEFGSNPEEKNYQLSVALINSNLAVAAAILQAQKVPVRS